MKHPPTSVAAYDAHAAELSQMYESLAFEEARSSLALRDGADAEITLEDVFDGMQVRRALLRQDQRLPEWNRE